MGDAVMWISPEAPAPQASRAGAGRGRSHGPLRFGVLDNSKSNADQLLGLVIAAVRAQHPDAVIVQTRKPSAANRAGAELLDRLERETDVVVSAMAD